MKRTEGSAPGTDFVNAYPDTSVIFSHQYLKRNFLGNIGLSNPEYILDFKRRKAGFILYTPPLAEYKINKEDVEYCTTLGPFAQLSGFAGSKQMQMFKMLFANSFSNGLNFSLKLNRYSSQGFYAKQQSFVNNFYSALDFETQNKVYGFSTFLLVNNNRFQENGGILKDTLNEMELDVSKELIPVKMNSASRDNREFSAGFTNRFRLTPADNLSEKWNAYFVTKTGFDLFKYKFTDQNSGFENNYFLYYIDTLQTKDSTRILSVTNEVSFLMQNNKKNLSVYASYKHEWNNLWQYTDTTLQNHIATVGVNFYKELGDKDAPKRIIWNGNGEAWYIAAGNQSGNYLVETDHVLDFLKLGKSQGNIRLKLAHENRSADYMYRHWYSNHFAWTNTFNTIQTTQAALEINYWGLHAKALIKNYTNLVYIDHVAYPVQYAGNILNTAFTLGFDKVFFKHLGLRANHTFQNSSSAVVLFPEQISSGSLYYCGSWFKGNLQLNTGCSVEYYHAFIPYAYMPATQQFYIQERFTTGNFPYADVFFNARVRPVTVFLKMENVLHGLMGTNYSLVPGYFQPERAFRFGITWVFFD